jgi:hypothetical protein
MFTRRRNLDRRRHYTREFLESFVGKLREAEFDRVTVILPHNYPSVDPKNSEISFEDFLKRERNFSAVILRAISSSHGEMMKVLFINSNGKAIFSDDTFPMAESESSGLFFQSPDPARAYALFQYFYELLTTQSLIGFFLLGIGSLLSILVILIEILSLVSGKIGFLFQRYSISVVFDIVLTLLSLWIVYRFSAFPTGLWIKPKRDTKLVYLANMAIRGELKDNPLVQLIITVIGGLIVAFLAKVLGLFK